MSQEDFQQALKKFRNMIQNCLNLPHQYLYTEREISAHSNLIEGTLDDVDIRLDYCRDLLEWVETNAGVNPAEVPEMPVPPANSSGKLVEALGEKAINLIYNPTDLSCFDSEYQAQTNQNQEFPKPSSSVVSDVLRADNPRPPSPSGQSEEDLLEEIENFCARRGLDFIPCRDESNLTPLYPVSLEGLFGLRSLNKILLLNTPNMEILSKTLDNMKKANRTSLEGFVLDKPTLKESLQEMSTKYQLGRDLNSVRQKKFRQALVTVPNYFPDSTGPDILSSIMSSIFYYSKKEPEKFFFSAINMAFESHESGMPHLHIGLESKKTKDSDGKFTFTRENVLKFFYDNRILPANQLNSNPYNIMNVSLSSRVDSPQGPLPYVAKKYLEVIKKNETPIFKFNDTEYLGYIGLYNAEKTPNNKMKYMSCKSLIKKPTPDIVNQVKEQQRIYNLYTDQYRSLKIVFMKYIGKKSTQERQSISKTMVRIFNEKVWEVNHALCALIAEYEEGKKLKVMEGTAIGIGGVQMHSVFDYAFQRGYLLDFINSIDEDSTGVPPFPMLKKWYFDYPVSRKRFTNFVVNKKPMTLDMFQDYPESKQFCDDVKIPFSRFYDSVISRVKDFVIDCSRKKKRANFLWIHGPPMKGKTKFIQWLGTYVSCVAGPRKADAFVHPPDGNPPEVFIYDDALDEKQFGKLVDMFNGMSTSGELVVSVKYDTLKAVRPSILICSNHSIDSITNGSETSKSIEAFKKRVTYVDLSNNNFIIPPEFTGFSYSSIKEMTDAVNMKDNDWVRWCGLLSERGLYPYIAHTLYLDSYEDEEEVERVANQWFAHLPDKFKSYPKGLAYYVAFRIQQTPFPTSTQKMIFKTLDLGLESYSKKQISELIGTLKPEQFEEYSEEKLTQLMIQGTEEYQRKDEIVMVNPQGIIAKAVKTPRQGVEVIVNGSSYPMPITVGDGLDYVIGFLGSLGFTFPEADVEETPEGAFEVFKRTRDSEETADQLNKKAKYADLFLLGSDEESLSSSPNNSSSQ